MRSGLNTHILYVLLFTLPERSLRRTVLLLALHQARFILHIRKEKFVNDGRGLNGMVCVALT